MSKEPIPNNFFLDAIKFLYRWGLRLIFLVVALILSFFLVFLIETKYDSWAYEKVNLISLKCGPIISDTSSAHPELFISLRGTRKDKNISELVTIVPETLVTSEEWRKRSDDQEFEYSHVDLQTQRDEYIYERVFEDGSKLRVSLDRKTLRRSTSTTTGSVEKTTFRDCAKISVKDYEAKLESVKKAFSEGNKI
jgi:hypothetical protein